MKEFSISTNVFFGENSLGRLQQLNNKRVLIVCDEFMKNSGVVDSGYRGEIILCLFNANTVPCYISKLPYEEIEKLEKGKFVYFSYEKAVAQGVVHKLDKMKTKEVSYAQLKKISSLRRDGKMGSSKK